VRVLAIIFSILVFLFLIPLHAHAGDFVTKNFHSNITIQNDGKVAIVEKIDIDFDANEKHGIYRNIPYVYESESGEKTYTELTINKVKRNGNNEPYEVSKNDTNLQVKIGDADVTITGTQTYELSYTAIGVLRGFADHDELYWNVTGNDWPVTIEKTSATVSMPKGGISKVACYEGYEGSQRECDAFIPYPNEAGFPVSGQLGPYNGKTIVVGFEKGLVPILTVVRPKTFFEKIIEWPSLLTLGASIIGAIGTILYLWHKNGRDRWFGSGVQALGKEPIERAKPIGAHESVVVEFTPPENLRPAEIGVLMDERAHTHDIVATIIDLAARGYLTITEIPKKWMFGDTDYELKKKGKEETSLISYEKVLLKNLFENGDTVKISSLKKTFYDELKEVKGQLYKDLIAKGYFPKNPESVQGTYVGIGIVLIIFGGIALSITASNDYVLLADISFALIVAGILFLIFSFFMPHRTAHGRELFRRARGYKLFISGAEKYRQQFFEKKNLFNEVLPYAIMFGLTDKFAKSMEELGVEMKPTWYQGSRGFTPIHFTSSMNHFAGAVSSAIASTPSGSGFSSGGSSGGGFGGGGGGSW
jgi:uncharacterized membrane protein